MSDTLVPWVKEARVIGVPEVGDASVIKDPEIIVSLENKPKVSSVKDMDTLVPSIRNAVNPY